MSPSERELLETAREVRERAYAPYSRFRVGAALEATDGAVYAGVNIENASFPVGICAERAALAQAVSDGRSAFRRIAIATGTDRPVAPCGLCRQTLREFDAELEVVIVYGEGQVLRQPLHVLLPWDFGPADLARGAEPARADEDDAGS